MTVPDMIQITDDDGRIVGRFTAMPDGGPITPTRIVSFLGTLYVYLRPVPWNKGDKVQWHEYREVAPLILDHAMQFARVVPGPQGRTA